jgi:hypothetical protein
MVSNCCQKPCRSSNFLLHGVGANSADLLSLATRLFKRDNEKLGEKTWSVTYYSITLLGWAALPFYLLWYQFDFEGASYRIGVFFQ